MTIPRTQLHVISQPFREGSSVGLRLGRWTENEENTRNERDAQGKILGDRQPGIAERIVAENVNAAAQQTAEAQVDKQRGSRSAPGSVQPEQAGQQRQIADVRAFLKASESSA